MTAKQRVERCSARYRRALADRNEAILTAAKEGMSLREIAEAAGLSHTAIRKIINR